MAALAIVGLIGLVALPGEAAAQAAGRQGTAPVTPPMADPLALPATADSLARPATADSIASPATTGSPVAPGGAPGEPAPDAVSRAGDPETRSRVHSDSAGAGAAGPGSPMVRSDGGPLGRRVGGDPHPRVPASPLLPPGHWASAALRRADALGLTRERLFWQRQPDLHTAYAALLEAAARATAEMPHLSGLAGEWVRRFAGEFPGVTDGERGAATVSVLAGAVTGGIAARDGAAAPGIGEFEPDRTGALPVTDTLAPTAGAHLALGFGPHVVVQAAPAVGTDRLAWSLWDVRVGLDPFVLAVGRQPPGFGMGLGGGVVLTGAAPLDRVEVGTSRPVRLPGLGFLGPVTAGAFVSRRLTEERHFNEPYLWGGSFLLRPFPWFTVGVSRAALFGSTTSETPITAGNLLRMFVGLLSGDFEDQVVSVSGSFRLPTDAVLPLTAYLEWGAEDAAGAWFAVPGQVVGLWSPALPGAPGVSVGVEAARFAPSCCGNPEWYRHWGFPGSWAAVDAPLGHPLGGEGKELSLYGAVELGSPLRLDARLFGRDRGAENLYTPGREGRSAGGHLTAAWRPWARGEVEVGLGGERGDGWRERHGRAALRVFF